MRLLHHVLVDDHAALGPRTLSVHIILSASQFLLGWQARGPSGGW